jgi:hypothetical protein
VLPAIQKSDSMKVEGWPLSHGQCQVPWPDHDGQQGFPPDQLGKCDGEHPACHPQDSAGGAAGPGMNDLGLGFDCHRFSPSWNKLLDDATLFIRSNARCSCIQDRL